MQEIEISEKNLDWNELESMFYNASKLKQDFKVGIEFERLPISTSDYRMVDYSKTNGVYDLLRDFAKLDGWEYIVDDYNIIGLKKDDERITLEPGSQVELSFSPEKNIADMKAKIDNFDKRIKPILKKYDIKLLEYGISPVSTYKYINLIPKKRYHIMADYLWGILSDVMMRETAGIQACYDFSSEEDAIRKFRIANILSPFSCAMVANSPIRGGVDTGYKTFRGLSWLNTDNERCNFMSRKLFSDKSYKFKDYIQEIMKTPMIFIIRNNKPVEILGKINFEQYMKQGFYGHSATLDDFKLHANMYFPDVRLRNFIEIRNHDCANHGMQYAILALYKGLLYNETALSDIEKLMSQFTYNQIKEFRYNVPRTALATKISKYSAKDIATEIIQIAQNGLKSNETKEELFLNPLIELTPLGLTPADKILEKWNKEWGKDVSKFIEFLDN